jgi:hypothetical protein
MSSIWRLGLQQGPWGKSLPSERWYNIGELYWHLLHTSSIQIRPDVSILGCWDALSDLLTSRLREEGPTSLLGFRGKIVDQSCQWPFLCYRCPSSIFSLSVFYPVPGLILPCSCPMFFLLFRVLSCPCHCYILSLTLSCVVPDLVLSCQCPYPIGSLTLPFRSLSLILSRIVSDFAPSLTC